MADEAGGGAGDSRRGAPLAGVKVLDLSRVLAGPMSGRLLADLGADVVKLEPPEPDLLRLIAPKRDRGMSGLYTMANVGKRNVCVDLSREEGRRIALGLARWADAVIENFRPGVLEKLGLGWDVIHVENPKLVLLSINGFGRDSVLRERRAYAPIIHAMAGIIQYHAEYTGSPLTQLADNQADINASLHGAIGLLAALHAAQRTGQGRHVEVPLFDALLATYSETPFVLLDEPVHRDECRLFDAAAHGHIAIAGPPQNAWALLRDTHGLEDPAPGRVPVERKAQRRHAAIEAWMASQPSVELLLERLEIAGLAAGRVESLSEVLRGELAASQGLLHEVDDRRGGTRPLVRSPYRVDGERCTPVRPAPRRGEHNADVLRELLGYDASHIDDLERAGVLQASLDDEP